jgi:hypothetical protein
MARYWNCVDVQRTPHETENEQEKQQMKNVKRGLVALFFIAPLTAVFARTGTGEAHVAEPPEIREIPVAEGLASHPVNGGDCLISDGQYQYIAFYDGQHQLTVGKRKLSETKWDFAKLPERVGWDTHNKIVLFQDRTGHLHVTGNMHCAPLRYYRTTEAGGIHTFEGVHTWTGDRENRVTYPALFKLRDGSIYMMYRHGSSGDGMRILVHYDERTQQWTKTVPVLTNGRDRKPQNPREPTMIYVVEVRNK